MSTEQQSTALAVNPDQVVNELRGLMVSQRSAPMTALQVRQHMGLLQNLLKDVLVEGLHFGVPPAMGRDTKPFLFDTGAQKIRLAFNLRAEYEVVQAIEREDFIGYVVRTKLFDRASGVVVGEALGACNSRERKYRYRTVPAFKAKPGDRERAITVEQKSGSNGAYEIFTIENDPWDFQQVILSMAQVRSSKKATRDALAASDVLGVDEEFAEQLIADADVVMVAASAPSVAAKMEAMKEKVAGGKAHGQPPIPRASVKAPAAEPAAPADPRAGLLASVTAKAKEWSEALSNTREDFRLLVQDVSKHRTSDFRDLTPDEAEAIIATMDGEIARAAL